MADENNETENNNSVILYDLTSYTKWTSEINLSKEQNVYAKYQKNQINNYSNFFFKFGSWLKSRLRRTNENNIKFLFNSSKPWNQWKLAISKHENIIAILQENLIEVYSEFSTFMWRAEISTQFVKICNLFINERSGTLCFTNEFGNLAFYDIKKGTEFLKYIETDSIEFENAICKVFFIEPDSITMRNSINQLIEIVITVSYSGFFNVFAINDDKTITKIYSQSLLNIVPNGVYCAEIDEKNQYLIIGSNVVSSSKHTSNGVFIWRVLNSEPWLKHVPVSSDNLERNKSPNKYLAKVNFTKIEYVTKLEIAPNNLAIAVIYISGKIAIYALPSLKLINEWFMTEQPCYNDINSDIAENPYEFKIFKQIYSEPDFRVSDIGWWSTKVLILTRGTGQVSLVSSEELSNLMGRNQQWLSPFPSIYPFHKNGFIILDCSCSLVNQADSDTNNDKDTSLLNDTVNTTEFNNFSDDDDVDEDDDSWYSYMKELVRTQAFNLSGIERFKALPKTPKFLKRKFSLLHFKSTTPEELFKSKLNSEEYGEALQLAKSYKLDTDLVYQKQWRSKPISKNTIVDYLSKIKKRSWILQECMQRVSPSIDTTKYLIDFGLRGTDLDSLIAIKEADDNRFFYSQKEDFSDDFDDSVSDIFNPEYLRRKKKRLEEIRLIKLSKIDTANLTLLQKELCKVRVKLLRYMDRLNVYELILGGAIKAAELFDPEKFQQIRSKTILEFTIDYAREGNADAVEILFSYFDQELKYKQLEVLSNFPETTDPEQYAKLLPRIEHDHIEIFNYPESIRDEKDWIETPEFKEIIENKANSAESNNLPEFTVESIENWYYKRTIEIENFSGQIDKALSFSQLALANGCKQMGGLIENLQTLFTLVYECNNIGTSSQTYYTLEYISGLSELERLTLIMSHSYEYNSDLYTKNMQEWLLPFISRRSTSAKREALLRDYLIKVSVEDLNPCLKLLHLKLKTTSLLNDINLISILIECLYVNEKFDQIDSYNMIINEISSKTTYEQGSSASKSVHQQQTNKLIINQELHERIKLAQSHLKACDIFKKYGVGKTLSYIRDSCLNYEKCREALVKLTWFASKKTSHLKPNEWIGLMKDLQFLQLTIYKSLITYQECTEIFLTSLLGSRNSENIKLAADWLRDIMIVDKECAVNLTVKVAQEYFNAAANYLDPDMEFSKSCLNLVKVLLAESKSNKHKISNESTDFKLILNEMAKKDPKIRDCIQLIELESDLIASMKIINEFEYNILPIQVRLSNNRLEIIKEILKTKSQSYKDYDRLLNLSALLRINPNKEQTEAMLLIAEYSLHKEINVVSQMCNKLVKLNYCPAWNCAYKLAYQLCQKLADHFKITYEAELLMKDNSEIDESDFLDNKISIFKIIRNHDFMGQFNTLFSSKNKTIQNLIEIEKLLSFSLTHCDGNLIEMILSNKSDIETARIKLEQTDAIVFKNSIQTEIKIDTLSTDYFCDHNAVEFDISLFKAKTERVKFLISTLLECKKNENLDKNLVLECLSDLIKLDANLALAYLLEISDENEANSLLIETLFNYEASISYEFVLYVFSLNMFNQLTLSETISSVDDSKLNEKNFIYHVKPSNLIVLFDDFQCKDSNSSKSFRKINRSFTEFKQNRKLKELNAGIDLKRFETDQIYKQDTILGLSMDIKTFELSCSLAKFYAFDLWMVYMSFTEYLFEISPSKIGLNELENKVKPLLPLLISRRDEFTRNMINSVLPLIDGKDLNTMIVFYELLMDDTSDFNVKIIKKLKAIDLGSIDYKKLLSHPLETIEVYLDDSNQQFFAKLLPKLPTNFENKLNSSKIYVLWCTKKIWSQVDQMFEENPIEWTNQNMNLFYDKFENLNESLKKLDLGTDFVFFVKELILSYKSCTKLNVQIRKNLLRRLQKFFKQQNKHDQLEITTNTLSTIQTYLKVIESVQKLFEQTDIVKSELYFQKLDFALSNYQINSEIELNNDRGDKLQKLEEILIDMLFNDFEIDLVSNIITIADLNDTSIKGLIKSALNTICSLLKESKEEIKKNEQLRKLKILLDNISRNLEKNEDINEITMQQNETKGKQSKKKGVQRSESTTSVHHLDISKKKIVNEDVMDCMRVFCNDQQVDLDLRLLILEELKKTIKNMKDEDLMLLLVYKTNAILTNCQKFKNTIDLIDSTSIQTEPQRLELILKFIELSETQDHYKAVVNLLKIWPTFVNFEKAPWTCALIKMIRNKVTFVEIVKDLSKNSILTDTDIIFIREELETRQEWNDKNELLKISYLKLCLAFKNKKLIRNFLDTIELECFQSAEIEKLLNSDEEEHGTVIQTIYSDKELMNLIIEDNFYCLIINTPLYSVFTYYLLRNETKNIIHEIIKHLKQKENFATEAAKLLLDVDRFFTAYNTLSASLNLLDRFCE